MNVLKRIYEDYFKKSRLDAYRCMLLFAKSNGYKMMSIIDYYYYLKDNSNSRNNKLLINRHDVDTSPSVARLMFNIEQEVYGHDGIFDILF